jgi:phosphoglycolate phosphatase-like HAD superfamily hydrolase
LKLSDFASIVFDCDGVILDSNAIKKEAFWQVGAQWGEEAAQALVDYHINYGGVSRYQKFSHFRKVILPSIKVPVEHVTEDEMLEQYAQIVQAQLLEAELADELEALRIATPAARWLVVSGGNQEEVRATLASREVNHFFDGGIFGSPDNKSAILERELSAGNILKPGVYLGDSIYDYECARTAGLDFIFISGWTEVKNWPAFVQQNQLPHVTKLADLLDC